MRRALTIKLLRDILHLRGQLLATALVVTCGVASYVAMRSTYESLVSTQESYYSEYRFGDVFAHLTRAPLSVRQRIERIPGIAAVQTRIVSNSILDLPYLREPASGRIVSIPEHKEPMLNDLHLVSGRYVGLGAADEVIVSSSFANANGFEPGDSFSAVLNGRWRELKIVGTGLSPEYIYEISPGQLFPDNKRFGIIWMSERAITTTFDMDGAFNDLSVTLAPGAQPEELILEIDRILDEYGGIGSFGRHEQESFRFLENEFGELRTFGTFLPLIFLGVTAFLLHLVMARLVNTQREQIGLLKAFGYSNSEIGMHFLGLAFAAVIGGILFGIVIGYWMGSGMTSMYTDYFRFPILAFTFSWTLVISSVLIALGSACIGAFSAVRQAVMLPPAEAMRPIAPVNYKPGLIETIDLNKHISPESRMIFRNLSRQPFKALLSAFGIAAAAALLFTGFYFEDAIKVIVDIQFERSIREDAIVTFNRPRPQQAKLDLGSLPGVLDVEAFRAVPARLSFEHRAKRVGVTGLESYPVLHRIVDQDSSVYHLPPEGIVLSNPLARELGVSAGESVTVEVLEGSRVIKKINVTGTVAELMGMNAYMQIGALNRLVNEDDVISGAYIRSDPLTEDLLYARLKRLPEIAGVSLPGSIKQSFNETFAQTIGIFTFVLVLFSSAIVFGVVYNTARITLSERGRELASLRVLGFSKKEVTVILLGEHAVLTMLAIPLGFLAGIATCYSMNNLIDNELLRLPMVFSQRTFLLTAIYVAAAAVISGLLVSWRLRGLDLIAVLKTRE
ncbi:MAG: ABC transporter permease [Acidobacteria bacterium]|nr:ABC transporter permease [Acidobacteriota bacterium]